MSTQFVYASLVPLAAPRALKAGLHRNDSTVWLAGRMLFTQECRSSFSPAFIMTRVRRPFLISRRRLLQASTVVAGVTSVSPLSSQDVRGQKAETLPASISGLKSRRDEAKPVSIEERVQRQERARVLMREEQIDAIL